MIPRVDDLFNLANAINAAFGDNDISNMEIIFHVDKEALKKINEDFYYRNGKQTGEIIEGVTEVNVNISGISVKYVTDDE